MVSTNSGGSSSAAVFRLHDREPYPRAPVVGGAAEGAAVDDAAPRLEPPAPGQTRVRADHEVGLEIAQELPDERLRGHAPPEELVDLAGRAVAEQDAPFADGEADVAGQRPHPTL